MCLRDPPDRTHRASKSSARRANPFTRAADTAKRNAAASAANSGKLTGSVAGWRRVPAILVAMPIASRCEPEISLIIDVYDGEVTLDEWRDHIAALLDNPAWRATTRSLSDMSSAHLPRLSDDERAIMFALFQTDRLRVAGRRMAIIAGGSGSVEREVEQSAIDKLGARAIVFSSLTAACIWLGVDENSTQIAIDELRASLQND